jgi:hypothetical protein
MIIARKKPVIIACPGHMKLAVNRKTEVQS